MLKANIPRWKNSGMNWRLIIDNSTKKQLARIPKYETVRLVAVIHELAVNPYAGDIEKMRGEKDVWRRRVGAYRIFYELYTSKSVVLVFGVKRRTSSTY